MRIQHPGKGPAAVRFQPSKQSSFLTPREHVRFDLAIDNTIVETGIHEHVGMDWAMDGGVFSSSTPLSVVSFTMALQMLPQLMTGKERVEFDWAMLMLPLSRTLPKQTVGMGWAMESYGFSGIPFIASSQFQVSNSTPVGTIPQLGSGLYSKWSPRQIKEVRGYRYGDSHEVGGLDEELTRHAWDLEVNVGRVDMLLQWNFIKNHFGAGTPFYFYDLQMNGWQYDPTGVSTNKRYLVRFDGDEFVQAYQQGERFVIAYTLIEVV